MSDFTYETKLDSLIITPKVARLTSEKGELIQEVLNKVNTEQPESIIVDFKEVEYIDSVGIQFIVILHNAQDERKKKSAFIGLRPDLTKLLTITKVDELVKIYSSLEEAMAQTKD